MKQAPIFVPPIITQKESLISVELLDEAKALHEAGKYIESIHRFIDGLGRDLRKKYGDAEGRVFEIPHGTIKVRIEIDEKEFRISTSKFRLPQNELRVALLRQVLNLNTRRLMLARFVKEEDTLRIEYHCPIAETHTYKLYSLVNNVCFVGNFYDEEFVSKFGVERLDEPQIRPYSEESIKRLHSALQTTGRYALEVASDLTNERNHNGAWAVVSTLLLQFLYYASPKGSLHRDVDKALDELDDDLPTPEQVQRARVFVEELLSRSADELAKGLYYEEVLSSDKNEASLQTIRDSFEAGYEDVTKALQGGNHERALIRLLHIIYRAYNLYEIPEGINAVLVEGLRSAGGKSVEEASLTLYRTVRTIMEGDSGIDQSPSLWQRVVNLFKSLFN